ncbi:hypothetical protein ACFYO1_02730 [Nocardia sp. NPDC006044]|uniref:hypothetical protein n=1 Tax=Nocardia sp. NPDC006044 TaxID=3364306 RepID=UPI0036860799
MSSPARLERVAGELSLDSGLLADRFQLLRDRRILFEEEGKVMSLVVIDETAQAGSVLSIPG